VLINHYQNLTALEIEYEPSEKDNNLHLNQLIIELNRLIKKTSEEYEVQKKRLNFLFKQLEKVKSLQTYQTNPQLLNAFLTIMGFYYQTDFNLEKMTTRMTEELEQIRKKIEPEDKTLTSYNFEELEQELERRKKLSEEAREKILKD
ncbi:1664_t:CDS:2, partial [Racocetra fulgida]